MDLYTIVAIAGVFGVLALVTILNSSKSEMTNIKMFDKVAKKFNLKNTESDLSGIVRNTKIKLYYDTKNDSNKLTLSLIPLEKYFCFEISKDKKLLKKSGDKKDFTTGDFNLDYEINIRSDDKKRTLALLNTDIRERFKYYFSYDESFMITGNEIKYQITESDTSSIIEDIYEMIKLSKYLTSEEPTYELLIQNIQNDLNEAYRVKCVSELVLKNKNNDYTYVFEELLNDRNKEIVFIAAQKLGDRGIQTIIDMFENSDAEFSDNILIYLKKYSKNPDVISMVLYGLNSSDYNKTVICAMFLNDINYDKMPSELVSKMKNNELMKNGYELCIEIVLFIGRLKIDEYVPFLIDKIKSENEEIQKAVLESFRFFDRIEFVEYILPLTKGFTPAEVKQKALKTIDSLQKNVSKDMKGTLSVADVSSEEGNLSVIDEDGDRGKLSLE